MTSFQGMTLYQLMTLYQELIFLERLTRNYHCIILKSLSYLELYIVIKFLCDKIFTNFDVIFLHEKYIFMCQALNLDISAMK